MPTIPDHHDNIRRLWGESKDYNVVLLYLRKNGFSKLESIKVMRELCEFPLDEAKRLTNLSDVWEDTLEETIQFHETLITGVNQSVIGELKDPKEQLE